MDIEFLSEIRRLPASRLNPTHLRSALSELLTRSSGHALTIKGVRDRFSAVNRLAKSGRIQMVKGAPGEETVILSVKDLADIIRAAAASMSFADGLAAAGFVPTGHRLVMREEFEHDNSLVLRPAAEENLPPAAEPETVTARVVEAEIARAE